MANLYVSEYSRAPLLSVGPIQLPDESSLQAEYVVAYSGTAVASPAFGAATRFVRLHTDSICSVAFGAAPVATATNKRLAANQTEYFGIAQGNGWKVSAISNV